MANHSTEKAAEILPTVSLSDEQIASFRQNGFLSLEQISPPEEVASLRVIIDRLVQQKAGFKEGDQYDLVGHDDGPPKLTQILGPENYAPELRHTQFRANAFAIAQQLLGPGAKANFEHVILKPAHYGASTPWHQDEAHAENSNFEKVSFWMPLQSASSENGCMQYIPGSNLGPVLQHGSPNNDPTVAALECCGDFDPATAVACPLPPGGCTIHHGRTLHHAGPNRSATPRCAYILVFQREIERTEKEEYLWNLRKHPAHQARKQAWRLRGGILVEIKRRGFGQIARKVSSKLKNIFNK